VTTQFVATDVVQPSPTPSPTPAVLTSTAPVPANPVATTTVTLVLTTVFTLTSETVTQPMVQTVQTAGPVTPITVRSLPVTVASTSAELVPAPTQTPAPRLALTGFDSRWMLLLAALAMVLGMLAVRLAAPTTTLLSINERRAR
jgi:hypothetical protein